MFDGGASGLHPSKSQYYASDATLVSGFAGREKYLATGPGSVGHHQAPEYELTQMDSMQEPLLSPRSFDYYQQQGFVSQQSLSSPAVPPNMYPQDTSRQGAGVTREAPVHRPQERSYSPAPTYSSDPQYHSPRPAYPPTRSQSPGPQQQLNQFHQPARGQSPGPHQQFNHPNQGQSSVPHQLNQYRPGGYSPPQGHSPQPQQRYSGGQQLNQFNQHSRQSSNNNLAGQGAYRGY